MVREENAQPGEHPRAPGGAGAPYHEPVLVAAVLEYLAPEGRAWVIDGTVGGGGHARAILERCPGCRLLGVDRDPEALAAAERTLAEHGSRVRLVRARFDELPVAETIGTEAVQAVLLDLGVSSRQIDRPERGFTFRSGAPLDMRMAGPGGPGRSAADVLNEESEGALAEIFRVYGEEPRAKALSRLVVARRGERSFKTSDDVVEVLAEVLGRDPAPKRRARVFQALRIAVNDELRALEDALPRFREVLEPGGRMVVISYHSLEDRTVKNAFRQWSRDCVCPPSLPVCRCRGRAFGALLTRRSVTPSEEEVAGNPRARSARLRAWRKHR